MSMLSEQVKELRTFGAMSVIDMIEPDILRKQLNQAADTIESLSAKLAAANMERSDGYYGGGWISCENGNHMPEEHEDFRDIFDPDILAVVDTEHYTTSDLLQVTVYDIDKDEYFVCDACTVDGKWSNFGSDGFKVIAWQPLPEPYHP